MSRSRIATSRRSMSPRTASTAIPPASQRDRAGPGNDPAPIATRVSPTAASSRMSRRSRPSSLPLRRSPAHRRARAKVVEPVDRATLIRQRWAETGIRMWNPRLHGAGDATLNIQGSVGLLPPAPGETMPRYDKLEFRMLGGQIVCEGVDRRGARVGGPAQLYPARRAAEHPTGSANQCGNARPLSPDPLSSATMPAIC